MGSYSSENEGYFDPWAYIRALKHKATSMGVDFVEDYVEGGKLQDNDNNSGIKLTEINLKSGSSLKSNIFVNAAGAWSANFIEQLKQNSNKVILSLPVEARKRCMFMFHCPLDEAPPHTTPLTVLPSGVYFRPEGKGGRFIAGVSPHQDNDPNCSDSDLDIIDHELFSDVIWPSLFEYVPSFGEIKMTGSWAGFYEYNTLDQNGIMGPHPDVKNLYHCTGFSGHGLQQSPAAGLAMAELIIDGKYTNIDVSRFSFDRIVTHEPIFEKAII
jgi:glycine/D-amino acid oxidase-like deaminating enzyme